MTTLARWQDAFAAALRGGDLGDCDEVAALTAQPSFAVYRNTVWKGWVDAIEANYPAVSMLVGRDWLRAAAAAFARRHPPASPVLVTYGAAFPAFLADFPPAADLPYLADVARLDRGWTEAHTAADAASLGPVELAGLSPPDLARLSARPHPALRAFWFDSTIPTLWLANRPDFPGGALCLEPRPEGLVLVRPGDTIEAFPLDAGGDAILAACRAGRSLLAAAAAAQAAAPDQDPGSTLFRLAAHGAFAGLVEAVSEDMP
jgi:hypothetical protein